MTVQVQRRGAVATILLDRPQAMNAVNAELGDELLAALTKRRRRRRRPRRRADRQRPGVLLRRRPALGLRARPRTVVPTSQKALRERFHPIILSAAADAQAGRSRPSTAPRRASAARSRSPATSIVAAESSYFLLAFVNIGLVPDGGSSVLIPERDRLRPRGRDGDARRAPARAGRRSSGA